MSEILSSIHRDVALMHEHGFVDSVTMRRFDALCLEPVKTYEPSEICTLRERSNASQSVFAVCNKSCSEVGTGLKSSA